MQWASARGYHQTEARWLSPDPAGMAAVDIMNPQSWNRYAYVGNNPVSRIDPSGLCDVVSGGFGQSPGTPQTAAQENFAAKIGADLVYPFSGQTTAGSLLGLGSNATTAPLFNAIVNAAQQTPSGQYVNIVTWSGSASVLSDVVGSLPADVASRIGSVTYLSPGMGPSDNYIAGNGDVQAFFGTGSLNELVTTFATPGALLNCDTHSANCFFQSAASYLMAHAGSACPTQNTYTRQNPRGGRGGGRGLGGGIGGPPSPLTGGNGGGWNIFGILDLIFGLNESVTHIITY